MLTPLPSVQNLTNIAGEVAKQAAELTEWLDNVNTDKSVKPADIAAQLFHIKDMYEKLDTAVKRIYHVKDRLDKNTLPERLSDFGMDMIRIPEIARSFSILDKTSASMPDKVAGYAWLRENGLGDLIQETVNAGTLASAMRNMVLEQGIEPPVEIIAVKTYKAMSINKYTPK